MVSQSRSGGAGSVDKDGIEDESAKNLLDSIGKIVHKEVEKVAANYSSQLKGTLSNAKFEKKQETQQTPEDPCKLNHEYHTNATNGRSYPCRAGKEERFSNTLGGQCTKEKISGSNDNEGACAPYRRLHLCDKNLEQIKAQQITTHNLLAEVCLAAKYEGDLIKTHYPKHEQTNKDSPSQLCTVLARSFADIGDIVRGKDLYLGNKKQNEIQCLNDDGAKKHYGGDPDFFKLREDWWTANRETVWKAITCDVKSGSQYFRPTCGDSGSPHVTPSQCRCKGDQVPTYFDYVPQFLRWFEEWAEDFCRKKKHKLKDAIDKCREKDKSGKERYCDLNGYDCEKTKRGINMYRWDYKCTGCFLSCSHFRTWIDNQKEQFDKQVKKYTKEITSGGGRTRRGARGGSDHKGYEKIFYEKLQSNRYGDVNNFLEKLSREGICQKQPQDGEKISSINFTNANTDDIFSPTEYCQACPLCGVEKESNGGRGNTEWKRKEDSTDCPRINLYKPTSVAKGTPINFLYSGDEATEIGKKLKKFCDQTKNGSVAGGGSGAGSGSGTSGSVAGGSGDCGGNNIDSSLCEPWKCYHVNQLEKDKGGMEDEHYNKEVENGGGLCILEKTKNDEGVQKQKTFNNFFYYWVVHMLKDSIYWRTEKIKGCLENGTKTRCKNNKKCNSDCECFKRWIGKKEKEWGQIKVHFKTQENLPVGLSHYKLLELLLKKDVLLESIKEAYGNEKDIEHIEELLDEEKKREKEDEEAGGRDSKKKNTIDKLLQHEEDEAELCLEIHEDEEEGDENDECDDDHEELPIMRSNPCGDKSGSTYPALATKVAQLMHHKAKTQLASRGGRRALKADATKGDYKCSGRSVRLSKICDITLEHSNDSRGTPEEGPCTGKDNTDERFKIGTEWSNVEDKKTTSYKDVFLPPRRQHMCTSNLDVDYVTKKDNVNDTFLGNVLLAANYEAKKIKEKYRDPNGQNNHKGKCRALRYSFADIGDIIKGTDLWFENHGEKTTQNKLVQVFEKIKEELGTKYTGDNDSTATTTDPPYKQLRADWWEANRHKVWKAMKCAIRKEKIPCHGMPVDDYIPQRLRWMTEWAEWYCKAQSQAYEKLEEECGICMNGRCTGVSDYHTYMQKRILLVWLFLVPIPTINKC
ncbi:hypothetical protein PFTANZ_05912 [Plasmodium falciparum Tanzania (2000708)]|uniref:Duffy-binding-like domain-containing protein n=1 Tax=Plasmodium falciparum Tanzania (2000708) TaxID=1036725 RepID=A0A024VXG2_PLAFA|nr:hypothetical protein PFTANZ_05912 [Plasmodium falciparum Tanzania (2000708)]